MVGNKVRVAAKMLTIREVSERLSVPVNTLRDWRRKGRGPTSCKLEGSIRYSEQGVEEYIAASTDAIPVRALREERRAL